MHGAARTGNGLGYIVAALALALIALGLFSQDEPRKLMARHEVWKVNAQMLIEAAIKYRGPADSTLERQHDGRRLDFFIREHREIMK